MTKVKFLSLWLAVFMLLGFLISCTKVKYNAVMYSTKEEWILTSFLEDNRVKGAYYKNPNYIENVDNPNDEYYYDEASPEDRTYIVDPNNYKIIFKENTLSVDFDKEIIYLYIFADTYPNRNYVIDTISFENEQLNIYYKLEKNNKNDVTAPYQRCLIVVMEKTNSSNVEFVKVK